MQLLAPMPSNAVIPTVEIIYAAVSATFMSALVAVQTLPVETVWDKPQMRMYCIIGSLGGAVLATSLFPPVLGPGNPARRLAIKFAASGIAGTLFTPILVRWMTWPIDVDVILATSGAVALIAVSTIHALVPAVIRKITNKVDDNEK